MGAFVFWCLVVTERFPVLHGNLRKTDGNRCEKGEKCMNGFTWLIECWYWDFLRVNVTQSAFNPYNVVGHLIALSLSRYWVCASLAFCLQIFACIGNFPMAPHSQLDALEKNNEKLPTRASEM